MTDTDLASPPNDLDLDLERDVSLSRHTYLRIGGPAAFLGVPEDMAQLERIATWAHAQGLGLRVIGGGSNVLIADEGVRDVVVSLRKACGGIAFGSTEVTAGAAVMLPALARAAAERDLGGLEFAIGIPGSVGGALQTNAGIGDGRCFGDLVRSVEVLRAGARVTLRADEIAFAYRETSLRGSGDIVLGATLDLVPRPRPEIDAEMRRLLEARQRTQPTAEPNAGSIFRNPPNDSAGRLIDAAGCKGLAVGHAQVSTLHANFIVHDGQGTATDIAALMTEVQHRVLATSGIRLRPEVEWWGPGDPPEAWKSLDA
ncbi:MAG: UDP-N-acetylmuramate dehydrogenase [Chloroflexota bacterium]